MKKTAFPRSLPLPILLHRPPFRSPSHPLSPPLHLSPSPSPSPPLPPSHFLSLSLPPSHRSLSPHFLSISFSLPLPLPSPSAPLSSLPQVPVERIVEVPGEPPGSPRHLITSPLITSTLVTSSLVTSPLITSPLITPRFSRPLHHVPSITSLSHQRPDHRPRGAGRAGAKPPTLRPRP